MKPSPRQMDGRNSLAKAFWRNLLSGWVVFGMAVVSGFILTPYILQKVGTSNYGLWVLAASLSGYLGLMDFGWGPAITTRIAGIWETGRRGEAADFLGAAFWLHLWAGILVAAIAFALSLTARLIFALTPSELPIAEQLILITGLTVAAGLPLSVFSTALSGGLFRHDLSNAVELVANALRVIITVYIMETSGSVVMLAWGVMIVSITAHVIRLVILRRRWPEMSIRRPPRHHSTWREFTRFGGWGFVWIAAERLLLYMGAVVIGIRFSASHTAVWAIGAKFGEYLRLLARASADVHLSLVARGLAQEDRTSGSQTADASRTFIAGSVMIAAIMLWFNGDLLLRWWVGEIANDAIGLMRWMILIGPAAALGLPAQANWIARGRLATVAVAAFVLTAVTAVLAYLVPLQWGLLGIAAAISIPTAVIWGILLPVVSRPAREFDVFRSNSNLLKSMIIPVFLSVGVQAALFLSRPWLSDGLSLFCAVFLAALVGGAWMFREIRGTLRHKQP